MKATNLLRASFVLMLAVLAGFMMVHYASASPFYSETDLVSDIPGRAVNTDADLVNSWGISSNRSGGPFWVSDNGTGSATLYDGNGAKQSLVVTIPPSGSGTPTGNVFNGSSDFAVSSNNNSGPGRFIFATEDGTISGWNPGVNPNTAIVAADNSASGAVYKGLAVGSSSLGNFLFAANFNSGAVDMFDKNFKSAGSLTDPTIPSGFAPFNAQNIGGNIFVTYAKQNAAKHDDVAGPGNGFVNVFSTDGTLIRRFASQGTLNSPWGVVVAPANFGQFSNDILIGNFGDGRINAFDPTTGNFLGQLTGLDGNPLAIDGLWGLTSGVNTLNASPNSIYFTAGVEGEAHGLFGTIQPVPEPATILLLGAGLAGLAGFRKRNKDKRRSSLLS